jgi:hypothetical protein
MIDAIMCSASLEQLREIYIATVKSTKNNQSVLAELEKAKDIRKQQLTEISND